MQQFVDWRKLAINDSSGCAKYTQELNSNCQKGKKLKNRIKTGEKYTSVATIYYPIEEDHPRKIFISLSNRKIISPLGFCFFKLTTHFLIHHTARNYRLTTRKLPRDAEPAPLDFSLCHPLFVETFWFPQWFRSFAKPWGSRARGLTMPANTYFPVPRFI